MEYVCYLSYGYNENIASFAYACDFKYFSNKSYYLVTKLKRIFMDSDEIAAILTEL